VAPGILHGGSGSTRAGSVLRREDEIGRAGHACSAPRPRWGHGGRDRGARGERAAAQAAQEQAARGCAVREEAHRATRGAAPSRRSGDAMAKASESLVGALKTVADEIARAGAEAAAAEEKFRAAEAERGRGAWPRSTSRAARVNRRLLLVARNSCSSPAGCSSSARAPPRPPGTSPPRPPLGAGAGDLVRHRLQRADERPPRLGHGVPRIVCSARRPFVARCASSADAGREPPVPAPLRGGALAAGAPRSRPPFPQRGRERCMAVASSTISSSGEAPTRRGSSRSRRGEYRRHDPLSLLGDEVEPLSGNLRTGRARAYGVDHHDSRQEERGEVDVARLEPNVLDERTPHPGAFRISSAIGPPGAREMRSSAMNVARPSPLSSSAARP